MLGTDELKKYIKVLEEGRIENPVTEKVSLMKWEAQIHKDSLQEYIDRGGLTVEGQLSWAREKLIEREHSRERRDVTQKSTRNIPLDSVLPFAKMIRLKGGTFTMGSPFTERGRERNENQVEVELSPFEIMDTPVTQSMWYEIMGENPSFYSYKEYCNNHKSMGGVGMCPDLPVERVSWNNIQRFLKKLNYSLGLSRKDGYGLPTEAQWEYAVRAGTRTAYWFGDDPGDLDQYAWYGSNSGNQTRPVRSKRPNPWGLYDMHGNVSEWVRDYHSEQLMGGLNPLQANRSSLHVIRGGNWGSAEQFIRSADRGFGSSGFGSSRVGFRLARRVKRTPLPVVDKGELMEVLLSD